MTNNTMIGVAPRVKREMVRHKCPSCNADRTVREKCDRAQYLLTIRLYKVKRGAWIHSCDKCGWVEGMLMTREDSKFQLPYCVSCSTQIPSDFTHCQGCGQERL
jgi:predicted RNA-binding Zn-ribbon protein involved in translation (DUF1610 family)